MSNYWDKAQSDKHSELPWNLVTTYSDGSDRYGVSDKNSTSDAHVANTYHDKANAEFIVTACNSYYQSQEAIKELVEALESTERMIKEALPKFNWGDSALDANAINLLNEAPAKVHKALAKAKEQSDVDNPANG